MLYDTTLGLSAVSPAGAFGLLTDLSLNLTGKGKTSDFSLVGGLNYPVYLGPGAPAPHLRGDTLTARFQKHTKLSTVDVSTSFSRQDASTTELDESGVVTVGAARMSRSVKASFKRDLDPRNTISIGASASKTSYTGDPALVGSTRFGFSGTWGHKLTKLTDIDAVIAYERFDADDVTKADNNIYRATAGVASKLTKRLSVAGAAGVSLVHPDAGTSAASAVARIGLDYVAKNTTVSFSAAREASPSSLGVVESTTTLGVNVAHRINEMSSATFSARFKAFTSSSGPRDVLIISPAYSRRLSDDADVQFLYAFTRREDLSGVASSHRFVMKFVRRLDIIH